MFGIIETSLIILIITHATLICDMHAKFHLKKTFSICSATIAHIVKQAALCVIVSSRVALMSLMLLHRDILCHHYPCRIVSFLPCYSYIAHHVTHCLVSMLCHFAILRMSRMSLYVAFVAPPITSVWFPVSLRLHPHDSSPLSSHKTFLSFLFLVALGIALSTSLTSIISSLCIT